MSAAENTQKGIRGEEQAPAGERRPPCVREANGGILFIFVLSDLCAFSSQLSDGGEEIPDPTKGLDKGCRKPPPRVTWGAFSTQRKQ